jgi:N-carbamoylputrescine amidase
MTMLRGQAITGGFFLAMVNRVGIEGHLDFFGSSFVSAPDGRVFSQLDEKAESCLVAELDLDIASNWHVHQQFVRDRRVETFKELVR